MTGVVHSIMSKTLVLRVQKLKQPIFCDVNSGLNQNMSKFMITYESVSTSPVPNHSSLYSIRPISWVFCDGIKLSDSW